MKTGSDQPSAAAQAYLRGAHVGAVQSFDPLRFESEGLARLARQHGQLIPDDRRFVLETPSGQPGAIGKALALLAASPLSELTPADSWATTSSTDDERLYRLLSPYRHPTLYRLDDLYRRCACTFEDLRREADPNTAERRALPPVVLYEVARLYQWLLTPIRYDVRRQPSTDELREARFERVDPLSWTHLVSVVALTCLAHALSQLRWAVECTRQTFNAGQAEAFLRKHGFDAPRRQADWHARLAEVLEEPALRLMLSEAERETEQWLTRAARWLDLEAERLASAERELAAEAEGQERALAEERAKRSRAGSIGAQSTNQAKAEATRERVLAAWDSLGTHQRDGGGVTIVARRLNLSAPTVRKHLADTGRHRPKKSESPAC